ncbi:MAG: hypothetical protein ABIB47_02060 [Candidatus Woesearchaeota archaeon]
MAKNIRKLIKKIPGYGSGNVNKMMFSTLIYAALIFILFIYIIQPMAISGSLARDQDVTPLAVEWGVVGILLVLFVFVHLKRKKWKK